VGWLGDHVLSQAPVDAALVERLIAAEQEGERFQGTYLGYHNCELCSNALGAGFFLIEHEGQAFYAPRLLVHYIVEHQYQPPAEFVAAVLNGRFVSQPPQAPQESIDVQGQLKLKMWERQNRRMKHLMWAVPALISICILMLYKYL
jgi:hypothetical protein